MPETFQPPLIFNRQLVRRHRDRASIQLSQSDFLLREIADRLADRLQDVRRQFPLALNLGAATGIIAPYLAQGARIGQLVQSDTSPAMIAQAQGLRLAADDEMLPFADNSFDLVIGSGSLHWINDLPGSLIQINRILKPDGMFLATLPGGDTLKELRQSFEQAEMSASGGVSPRISPFIDIRDAGSLLQRAGFSLPVIDSETLTVSYEHPLKLLRDLRQMGETNALHHSHKGFTPCSLVMGMADYYLRHFSGADGRIPASFELVTLTAWKPHASQQQPAKRGSGNVPMHQAFK
jgi:NADH dehydrogenase [ubiquinone] 1 alpha subcomplex assembly factor 5